MKRLLSTLLGFLSLFVLISFGFTQTTPRGASTDSHASSLPKLPFIKKPACPGEGCSFGKWVLANPVVVYERPDIKSKIVARLEANFGVEALTGEVHTRRYGEIRVIKNIRLQLNEADLDLHVGDVLYEMEYLGEGQTSVWFQGRIYTGWVLPDVQGGSEGVWGRIVVQRLTDWWVQIRRSSDNLCGWIVNPKRKGGCYDCDRSRLIESQISDIRLLIEGKDYSEAKRWLQDLDHQYPNLVSEHISEASKRSISELRTIIDQKFGETQ